ncbi:CIAO1 [Scenedesmus sp. PABB004]|nr:CIAO1 [Scenedesmus sp. PABB004]
MADDEAKLAAFRAYDWECEAFASHLRNVELPGAAAPAALLKVKAKWFKRHVDPDFEPALVTGAAPAPASQPPPPPPQQPRSGGAGAPAAAAAAPPPRASSGPVPVAAQALARLPYERQLHMALLYLMILVLTLAVVQPFSLRLATWAYLRLALAVLACQALKVHAAQGLPRSLADLAALRAWAARVLSHTDGQWALLAGAAAATARAPFTPLVMPWATVALVNVAWFAHEHHRAHPVWAALRGEALFAWLASRQAAVGLWVAQSEIAAAAGLTVMLLTPRRQPLLCLVAWNVLRMRFWSVDAALQHRQVWGAIGALTARWRAQFPVLQKVADFGTRYFHAGRGATFAELWRLKVHYRAPPDIRGSGKERGHGTELTHCPKCGKGLKPGKHHVGCAGGKSAPRAAKRSRQLAAANAALMAPETLGHHDPAAMYAAGMMLPPGYGGGAVPGALPGGNGYGAGQLGAPYGQQFAQQPGYGQQYVHADMAYYAATAMPGGVMPQLQGQQPSPTLGGLGVADPSGQQQLLPPPGGGSGEMMQLQGMQPYGYAAQGQAQQPLGVHDPSGQLLAPPGHQPQLGGLDLQAHMMLQQQHHAAPHAAQQQQQQQQQAHVKQEPLAPLGAMPGLPGLPGGAGFMPAQHHAQAPGYHLPPQDAAAAGLMPPPPPVPLAQLPATAAAAQQQQQALLPQAPGGPPPGAPPGGRISSTMFDDIDSLGGHDAPGGAPGGPPGGAPGAQGGGPGGAPGRVPSPPPLPADFPSALGCGTLFNFAQFSGRMPAAGGPSQQMAMMPRGMEAELPPSMDELWTPEATYDHHSDGDLMQLLFGAPEQPPTMATIHLHHFLEDDACSSPLLGGMLGGSMDDLAAAGAKAAAAGGGGAGAPGGQQQPQPPQLKLEQLAPGGGQQQPRRQPEQQQQQQQQHQQHLQHQQQHSAQQCGAAAAHAAPLNGTNGVLGGQCGAASVQLQLHVQLEASAGGVQIKGEAMASRATPAREQQAALPPLLLPPLRPSPLMGDSLELLQTLQGHTDRVWHCAWSPDGSALASCSGDRTVRIWSRSAQRERGWRCAAVLEDTHTKSIRSCCWSPGGTHLATASFDGSTSIWQLQGGLWEEVLKLEGHENEVKGVAWSPCGNYLATCGRDKSVWFWERGPGPGTEFDCMDVKHGHAQDVKAVAWHPSRELLASCSYDDSVKLWTHSDGDWDCAQTLADAPIWDSAAAAAAAGGAEGHTSTVWGVAFSPDGGLLASVSDDRTLRVWRLEWSGGVPSEPRAALVACVNGAHTRAVYSVDWSPGPGASLLATGDGSNAIKLFCLAGELAQDGASSAVQPPLPPAAGAATGGSDAQGAASEGSGPALLLCRCSMEQAHAADVNCVRWHPSQRGLLASAGDDGVVKLWLHRPAGGAAGEGAAGAGER